MSHYTHHIDDSGKEPTVIEIKGEPYPEELDPELHEFNRITKRVAAAAFRERKHRLAYQGATTQTDRDIFLLMRDGAAIELDGALDEYEKMVSGE